MMISRLETVNIRCPVLELRFPSVSLLRRESFSFFLHNYFCSIIDESLDLFFHFSVGGIYVVDIN